MLSCGLTGLNRQLKRSVFLPWEVLSVYPPDGLLASKLEASMANISGRLSFNHRSEVKILNLNIAELSIEMRRYDEEC